MTTADEFRDILRKHVAAGKLFVVPAIGVEIGTIISRGEFVPVQAKIVRRASYAEFRANFPDWASDRGLRPMSLRYYQHKGYREQDFYVAEVL